nr:unnamed protein product [Human betaherpesvirus 6A]
MWRSSNQRGVSRRRDKSMRKYTRHGNADRRQRAIASMASVRKKKPRSKNTYTGNISSLPPRPNHRNIHLRNPLSPRFYHGRVHTQTHRHDNPPMW